MNYENATDFDLNKRLLELTCPPDVAITDIYQHRLAGKLKSFSHAMFKVEGCDDELGVNYCTDWNATMPLAVEHGVSFGVMLNGSYSAQQMIVYCRTGYISSSSSRYSIRHSTCDKNPLRAIVICLIKVLEAKQ